MKNFELVEIVFETLKKMNVSEIIICAGARNSPFVSALENYNFTTTSYFEERSAAFYALGRIKESNLPVAVITTSGTAVAELLPAVIEAYYQNLPLVIVSADRPQSYRGTGAPQSIEQKNIFSQYVQNCFDWDVYTHEFKINYRTYLPLHFNVCFDEPLIDGVFHGHSENINKNKVAVHKIEKNNQHDLDQIKLILSQINRPILVISEIAISLRPQVIHFIKSHKIPFYAEYLSGLKNCPDIIDFQIQSTDQILTGSFKKGIFKSVIRLGSIPTLRLWRDLEFEFKDIPVLSVTDKNFTGLSRPSYIISSEQFFQMRLNADSWCGQKSTYDLDKRLQFEKINLIKLNVQSEQSFINKLSNMIAEQPLYIGNSLPIRLWDLISTANQIQQPTYANRGANGIDGQISTYLGWSLNFEISWCLVGDLTALYDLASLGLSGRSNKKRIIIMNNGGGQIFSRLFGNKKYLNQQNVNFEGWANLWNWDYIKITSVYEFENIANHSSRQLIVECLPDQQQTDNFWTQWDKIIKSNE